MDAIGMVVLAVAWLALLAILHKIIHLTSHKQKTPPGPRPWPIIGNLNLLGLIPHQTLHELSKKYGEIMQLKFGSRAVIVATSPEMAKQFLKLHDESFASRPATAAGKYTAYNYTSMGWAPYDAYWRQARKIYVNHVLSPKRLESYEYIRVEERSDLISRLHLLSGSFVQLRDHLIYSTLSNISRMALGYKYFDDAKSENCIATRKEFHKILDEIFFLNGVFNIGDWIPWLSLLDLQGYIKRMKVVSKKLDKIHNYILDDHIIKRKKQKDFEARDIVDVLLQLEDDPKLEVKLTRDNVKALIQDLMLAGTHTSSITIEWAIAELLKHPHILEKAREELDKVIGKDRWVEEKDLPQLPYLEAIVKETLRLHPVATLLVPHLATEDCKIADYYIKKGTVVIVNVWAIGRDPKIWDSPEKFRPERFLGMMINAKGHHFEFIPFGSGRRVCPGYNLAFRMVPAILANLLHGFSWKLPGNMRPEDISMDEEYGIVTHLKFPIVAIMEPRLPAHLY